MFGEEGGGLQKPPHFQFSSSLSPRNAQKDFNFTE